VREPKTHFADLVFGRPCCGAELAKVLTRIESEVTCRACKRVLEDCAQSEAERLLDPARGSGSFLLAAALREAP
jgi:hypothetical protein